MIAGKKIKFGLVFLIMLVLSSFSLGATDEFYISDIVSGWYLNDSNLIEDLATSSFTDTFTSTTYKDISTTANWDTSAGNIKSDLTSNLVYTMSFSTAEGTNLYNEKKCDSFTVSGKGFLDKVEILTSGTDCNSVNFNIRTGSCSGTILDTGTISAGAGTKTITFDDNDILNTGTTYYLQSEVMSSTSCFWRIITDAEEESYYYSGSWLTESGRSLTKKIYVNQYDASNDAITTQIDSTDNLIYNATLTKSDTIPTNTGINYYLSSNGGVNWESVTPSTNHIFTNIGNDLRFKSTLTTTDNTATATLNDISINYTYTTTGYSPILDHIGINNGTLYGKTFNHGTNNGATLNNNLTGTITGATWNGNELEFDGDGDYIKISSSIYSELEGELTISGMVKPNTNDFMVITGGGSFDSVSIYLSQNKSPFII
jgi:hypothetical protein